MYEVLYTHLVCKPAKPGPSIGPRDHTGTSGGSRIGGDGSTDCRVAFWRHWAIALYKNVGVATLRRSTRAEGGELCQVEGNRLLGRGGRVTDGIGMRVLVKGEVLLQREGRWYL